MPEVWKPIPGHKGLYEASNMGRIRSVDRKINQSNRHGGNHYTFHKGKILKPNRIHKGYESVVLYKNKKRKRFETHTLIARTHLGARPARHDIHHINGKKTDNRLPNLVYMPSGEHTAHHVQGEQCHKARLTEPQVVLIRNLLKNTSRTISDIADEFNVSPGTIRHIKQRRTWKHIN